MATPENNAQAAWQDAKKIRNKIVQDIEKLKQGNGAETEEAQLKELDNSIAQFRLRFAATVFSDFKYACEQGAEEDLWKLHLWINQVYRNLLNGDRLKSRERIVTRRKVEKHYRDFLKIALHFYRGYFQRLWALFDLPQVARIAGALELETLPKPPEHSDKPSLQAQASQSFHTTLLRLGDLSRYRQKARQKQHGSENPCSSEALLYYSLAHDLEPTSGFAHHQMGIIFTDEGQHLNVVYHLYRSLAVEVPHPNAKQNLEREFKQLLQLSASNRRPGPPDPRDAFSFWFVRLHARFYQGENFSQHAEMEEEVLHRFQRMLKEPNTIAVLLKSVLINISAYHVTRSKVENQWTLSRSLSCQFVLRLNVRVMLVLARLLSPELSEVARAAPPVADSKAAAEFNAATENILPLLRIYMAWLVACRSDIINYEGHLEPFIYELYRALGQALTVVAKEFMGQQCTPIPYLLPEDVEALGMKPFDDKTLPPASCIHHLPATRTWKPHYEDNKLTRRSPEQETLGRVHDVLKCGFTLASDEIFPLVAEHSVEGVNPVIIVSYVEGGKAARAAETQMTKPRVPQLDSDAQELGTELGHLQASQNEGTTAPSVHKGKAVDRADAGRDLDSRSNSAGLDASDYDVDPKIYKQVENFLLPPEVHTDQGGKGTSTANDVFEAQSAQNSQPGPPGGRTMQGLPWEYFISPKPQYGPSREMSSGPGLSFESHRYAGPPTSPQGDPVAHRFQQSTSTVGSGSLAHPRTGLSPDALTQTSMDGRQLPPNQAGTFGFGVPNRPMTGFDASHYHHSGPGHVRQRFGGSADSSGASSFQSPWANTIGFQGGAGNGPANGGSFPPALAQQTRSGLGGANVPFSTNFSQDLSTLPSVNSPWGLPAAQRTLGGAQQVEPYDHQLPRSLMASAFHNRPSEEPFQGLVCNGNVYDATTAYGRGPVIPTKDDPSHFRNAVKGTHMEAAIEAADAYDKAVLAAALADDHPRLKG